MKNLLKISLLAVSTFVFTRTAAAQNITASAQILQSVTYSVNQNINFGNLEADFTSATLDPANSANDTGVGAGVTVANVLVSGAAGQTVLVTNPGTLTLVEGTSGDDLSLATDVTGETGNNASARGGTALTNGNELVLDGTTGEGTLWIGGTLTPGTDANGGGFDPGTYTTTFTLTLDYQ